MPGANTTGLPPSISAVGVPLMTFIVLSCRSSSRVQRFSLRLYAVSIDHSRLGPVRPITDAAADVTTSRWSGPAQRSARTFTGSALKPATNLLVPVSRTWTCRPNSPPVTTP